MRSRNTFPERQLQGALDRAGVRFRTHAVELPGTPDVVLDSERIAVFVHGCHWHRHLDCSRSRLPRTNTMDWIARFQGIVMRDQAVSDRLRDIGWWVYVAWECALKADADHIARDISALRLERRVPRQVNCDNASGALQVG